MRRNCRAESAHVPLKVNPAIEEEFEGLLRFIDFYSTTDEQYMEDDEWRDWTRTAGLAPACRTLPLAIFDEVVGGVSSPLLSRMLAPVLLADRRACCARRSAPAVLVGRRARSPAASPAPH